MRYILTGTPGSGKTAILRELELRGHAVVEEAATDVIALRQAQGVAEPWHDRSFTSHVATLQKLRLRRSGQELTYFDRSPVCTLALARHLGHDPSQRLMDLAAEASTLYAPAVFFVRGLGRIEPTAARRITPEEAAAFEKIHEQTYAEFGFTWIDIPPAPVPTRATQVERAT